MFVIIQDLVHLVFTQMSLEVLTKTDRDHLRILHQRCIAPSPCGKHLPHAVDLLFKFDQLIFRTGYQQIAFHLLRCGCEEQCNRQQKQRNDFFHLFSFQFHGPAGRPIFAHILSKEGKHHLNKKRYNIGMKKRNLGGN